MHVLEHVAHINVFGEDVVDVIKSESRALTSTGMTESVDELVIHDEESNTILVFVDLYLLLGKGVEVEVEGVNEENMLSDVHAHCRVDIALDILQIGMHLQLDYTNVFNEST